MFLARIVIPRSRSRSLESKMHSPTSWLARNSPLWRSRQSTSVVLPWSTWAMIAILRTSVRRMGVQGAYVEDRASLTGGEAGGGERPEIIAPYRQKGYAEISTAAGAVSIPASYRVGFTH